MSVERYVGIDVGGTKIEAVLCDRDGRILQAGRVPARAGESLVIQDILGLINSFGVQVQAVGVGIPGQVDCVRGIVRNVVNLDIVELALASSLSEQLGGIRVCVDNDVNVAALGAAWYCQSLDGLHVEDSDTIVFLNFGTGLAAGVVRAGRLEHGASGALGEIGHIPVDPNQLPCPCGQRGCLETIASGGSVAKLWKADPPMPDLIKQSRAGNTHAQEVLAKVVHAIADSVQIVIQAYDPRVIIIGGGMAKTGDPLLEVMKDELKRREASCKFLASVDLTSRLYLAPGDEPLGALGAALSVMHSTSER